MYKELITVMMSTSPIPSHPSTEIIDRVLEGIWHHLPDVKVFLMCDGIRVPEHESRRAAYEEYKSSLRSRDERLKMFEYENSVQQAFMFREILRQVETPLILVDEHDYLITPDCIDWERIVRILMDGSVNVLRFHNLDFIHPLHQHLMLGNVFEGSTPESGGMQTHPPEFIGDVPVIRTQQFWFAPHLARVDWYRSKMNSSIFSENTYCEIEPALYSSVSYEPWEQNRVVVYAPTMRRSQHLGGRGHDKDDPKREFTW